MQVFPNPEAIMRDYISAEHIAPNELRALVRSGQLQAWRRDKSGVQWYESTPGDVLSDDDLTDEQRAEARFHDSVELDGGVVYAFSHEDDTGLRWYRAVPLAPIRGVAPTDEEVQAAIEYQQFLEEIEAEAPKTLNEMLDPATLEDDIEAAHERFRDAMAGVESEAPERPPWSQHPDWWKGGGDDE